MKEITVVSHVRKQFVAEREHPLLNWSAVKLLFSLALLERYAECLEPTQEQIFLVIRMCIERGASDVRTTNGILDRQRLVSNKDQQQHAARGYFPVFLGVRFSSQRIDSTYSQIRIIFCCLPSRM